MSEEEIEYLRKELRKHALTIQMLSLLFRDISTPRSKATILANLEHVMEEVVKEGLNIPANTVTFLTEEVTAEERMFIWQYVRFLCKK